MKENGTSKKLDINFGAGIFLIIGAIIFLLETRKIADPGSKMFPYGICALTIIIGITLIVKSVFKLGHQEEFDFSNTGRAMLYALILLTYVLAINYIGFYIATPIYLVVGMLFLGQKQPKTLIGVALGTTLVIYLFFDLLLGMKIPQGIFFL